MYSAFLIDVVLLVRTTAMYDVAGRCHYEGFHLVPEAASSRYSTLRAFFFFEIFKIAKFFKLSRTLKLFRYNHPLQLRLFTTLVVELL